MEKKHLEAWGIKEDAQIPSLESVMKKKLSKLEVEKAEAKKVETSKKRLHSEISNENVCNNIELASDSGIKRLKLNEQKGWFLNDTVVKKSKLQ